MLRYTVTVTLLDSDMAERFIDWLRNGHIAEVMTGGATSANICRIDGDEIMYAIEYLFPSRAVFAAYEREHAPRLREQGRKLFPPSHGVVYQRSMADVIHSYPEPT